MIESPLTGPSVEVPEKVLEKLSAEAYIEACEIVGPNSLEFESLEEKLFYEALEQYMASVESF